LRQLPGRWPHLCAGGNNAGTRFNTVEALSPGGASFSVADAPPAITGAALTQIDDKHTATPFSTATISDASAPTQSEAVTVSWTTPPRAY